MSSHEDLNMLISSCMELLESHVGEKTYPDYNETEIPVISRQVAELLIAEGCHDKAAIVAAALGDLPYSIRRWKNKVLPAFGKKAADAYHDLCKVRVHGHYAKKRCDCKNARRCEHAHVKGCDLHKCVTIRMVRKAPYMSGEARAALLAWLSVMCSRMTNRNAPAEWSRKEVASYLHKASAVAQAVMSKGSKVKLSPVIFRLSQKIEQSVKDY